MSSPTPHVTRAQSFQASFVEVDGRTHYLAPGHRLTVGAARACDIVLDGPGVERKHALLYQRVDGWIGLKPLSGATVRAGRRRVTRPTAVAPGETLGFGLSLLHTGTVENNLYIQALLELRDLRESVRSFRRYLPGLAVSIVLHLLLVLLFLEVLRGPAVADGEGQLVALTINKGEASVAIEDEDMTEEIEDTAVDLTEPPPLSEVDLEEPTQEVEYAAIGPGPVDEEAMGALLFESIGPGKSPRKPASLKGFGDKARKGIQKLRRSGLEVALAFDSTGSMGDELSSAMEGLRTMLEELQALVPGTRVSLITYRDEDARSYVTRQTKLSGGHFSSLAFLSSVQAGEGGDFPEAVHLAIRQATKLRWRARARKVLILVGDAPPHRKDIRRAISDAQRFRRMRGEIHFLQVRKIPETTQLMQRIVKAGGGRILPLQNLKKLTEQILAGVLGADARRELARRFERRRRAETRQRQNGKLSVSRLVATLRETEPDVTIIESWANGPIRWLRSLPDKLRKTKLSDEGLQALYYIANRVALGRDRYEPDLLRPENARRPVVGIPKDLQRWLSALPRR